MKEMDDDLQATTYSTANVPPRISHSHLLLCMEKPASNFINR
jgi:hypothetical protein